MKVSELFEATQGEPGQGGKLKGGASYSPSYRADIKQLRGSVEDWIDAMGVTPEDIKQAMDRVRELPLFKNKLPEAGLMYEKMPASEKRGTFTFNVQRKLPNGKMYKTSYKIYANGQIRWAADRNFGDTGQYTSPLQSPKPRLKAGDPVKSLVMIYTASMEELLSKWKKSAAKMDKEQ